MRHLMADRRQWLPVLGLLVTIVAASCMVSRLDAAAQTGTAPQCAPAGTLARLAGVPEASGLAPSRLTPGRFWTHNDSGAAVLFALDVKGAIVGQVQVTGVKIDDWEALQSGPCPEGACLYLADIGDNEAERDAITVYRLVEPKTPGGSVRPAAVLHATYPDEPHDAETLLVMADGTLAIVTKGENAAIYRFPASGKPGEKVRLQRVGARAAVKGSANDVQITDGAVSPDGRWVALRTNTAVTFHPAAAFFAGTWTEAARVDLRPLREPQGEGLAFGPNNMLFVVGEGGQTGGGTFGRLTCGASK